jgi:hypothetical protein
MLLANTRISTTLYCDCAKNELATGQIVHAVLPKLIAKQPVDYSCPALNTQTQPLELYTHLRQY